MQKMPHNTIEHATVWKASMATVFNPKSNTSEKIQSLNALPTQSSFQLNSKQMQKMRKRVQNAEAAESNEELPIMSKNK